MVVDVQQAPLCPHTPHSTSTNTNTYTRCCTVDMEAGGGGHWSHVVPQATATHKTNKTHTCPPKPWLSTCSMRPCAHTRPAPPRQIQTSTHAAALSIWRREEAGMGHTWCHTPLSLIKLFRATAHQANGCRRAASAPVPAHAPLHLDKYKHIHTLLRCRYGGGRRRIWVTRDVTRTPHNCPSARCPQTYLQLSTCSKRPGADMTPLCHDESQ